MRGREEDYFRWGWLRERIKREDEERGRGQSSP